MSSNFPFRGRLRHAAPKWDAKVGTLRKWDSSISNFLRQLRLRTSNSTQNTNTPKREIFRRRLLDLEKNKDLEKYRKSVGLIVRLSDSYTVSQQKW